MPDGTVTRGLASLPATRCIAIGRVVPIATDHASAHQMNSFRIPAVLWSVLERIECVTFVAHDELDFGVDVQTDVDRETAVTPRVHDVLEVEVRIEGAVV